MHRLIDLHEKWPLHTDWGQTVRALVKQLLLEEGVRQGLHVRGLTIVGRSTVPTFDVLIIEHVVPE